MKTKELSTTENNFDILENDFEVFELDILSEDVYGAAVFNWCSNNEVCTYK